MQSAIMFAQTALAYMVQLSVYISPCILSGFQVFISCGLLQSGPVWATCANVAGSLQ